MELFSLSYEQVPEWLTLASTSVLGMITAYFAWRSRQLEARQARQINREFERELAAAELEIVKGSHLFHSWSDWKKSNAGLSALEVYKIARGGGFGPPEMTKVTQPLAFHLPEMEAIASDGVIKTAVAFGLLDMLAAANPLTNEQRRLSIEHAEEAMEEGDRQLRRVLSAIEARRHELRDGA